MAPTQQSSGPAVRFEPAEREEALKAIRAFLQEPANAGGGILLVAGPRGVGKTRLVDEALNEKITQGSHAWWRRLFGDSGVRRRLRIRRSPRGMERIVVPVAVDPFFPQSHHRPVRERPNAAKSTLSEGKANPGTKAGRPNDGELIHDSESDAIRLLDNIIFALTSMVDPRSRVRHGRTLRSRLGFWNYYFSSLALYRPDRRPTLGSALGIIIGLWGVASIFYIDWIDPGHDFTASLGIGSALLLLIALVFSWLGLRLRDWRRAAYRGARLYDLVHAQDTRQTDQHQQERSLRLEHKWTLGAGALLLLGALFFSELQGLDQEWAKPALWKAMLALIGTGLLIVGLRRRYSRDHKADFGPDNRAWRITLLRRYLFVLHQCGIEPVLVLDELDKLEEPRLSPASIVEKGDCESGESMPIELWRFQCALQRLKQSLGAEFLWILIGGQGLFANLQRHRQPSAQGMLGPLATLIRRELVLGPVSLETAQQYFSQREGRTDSSEEDLKRIAAGLWLEAKGIYSEMVRLDAERRLAKTDYPKPIQEYAQRLAEQVAKLWGPVTQIMALDLPQAGEQARFADYLLNREWNQVWLRTGFLELGYQLLSPHAYRLQHAAMEELPPPITAVESLADGDLEALIKLGRLALYGYLLDEYAQERPGIPPDEQGTIHFEMPRPSSPA
ncbi:ATP-binding protein [Candidatus Thiosymbion oneisti]|uniref:ATP-binding protein n=1 Tax=Candidatus Thiosymbion oneisti TaxID=589554 RepID=UPI000B7FAB4A|nr:ATP-binding protein [Candidatus Thiosymbion oneisti]